LDETGAAFYTDVTWGDRIEIDFANSGEEPTIDGFYRTVCKEIMDREEKERSLGVKNGEIIDDASAIFAGFAKNSLQK